MPQRKIACQKWMVHSVLHKKRREIGGVNGNPGTRSLEWSTDYPTSFLSEKSIFLPTAWENAAPARKRRIRPVGLIVNKTIALIWLLANGPWPQLGASCHDIRKPEAHRLNINFLSPQQRTSMATIPRPRFIIMVSEVIIREPPSFCWGMEASVRFRRRPPFPKF